MSWRRWILNARHLRTSCSVMVQKLKNVISMECDCNEEKPEPVLASNLLGSGTAMSLASFQVIVYV